MTNKLFGVIHEKKESKDVFNNYEEEEFYHMFDDYTDEPDEYDFIILRKATNDYKKYEVILKHKHTCEKKIVSFGNYNAPIYKDTTKLKLYTNLEHRNKQKQELFRKFHKKKIGTKFTEKYFMNKYLYSD